MNVLIKRYEFGHFFAQAFDPTFLIRQFARGGDEDRHYFAAFAGAADDMAQYAGAGAFVIGFSREFRADFAHGGEQTIGRGVLRETSGHIDNIVALAFIKADRGTTVAQADGDLNFIPIMERIRHADDGFDGDIDAADMRQQVRDARAFPAQLRFIIPCDQRIDPDFGIVTFRRRDAIG